MGRIIFICLGLVVFVSLQGNAQVLSKQDSIQLRIEQRRIADSTRISLKTIAIKKRQDSMMQVIAVRQAERKRIADSVRILKKKQRDALRQQNKEYMLRKKTREYVRDSIARESEKAALARKAYKKSLKKKKKEAGKTKVAQTDSVIKKKEKQEQVVKTKEPKVKKEKKKKVSEKVVQKKKPKAKKEKLVKEEKKTPEKKKVTDSKKLAKQEKKRINDSIKLSQKRIEQQETKVVKNPSQVVAEVPYHFRNSKISRTPEPPRKKESFFAFQLGSSLYLGDLGGNSNLQKNLLGDISFKENNFFYGFSFTQMRREALGIRLSYVFGDLSGSDNNTYFTKPSDPSYYRFVRNLDFQTKINEGSLIFELHPFKLFNYQKKLHNSFFQPYGLIGLGRFSFNPQGSLFDTDVDALFWYDLQPLSTEGQGMTEFPDREPYALTQWNIPHGFGFQYEISPTIGLGLEYVGRFLFTDYLDDVSTRYIDPNLFSNYFNSETASIAASLSNKSRFVDPTRAYSAGQIRGNPENNDYYFSISARLIIKISKNKKRVSLLNPVYKYDDTEICE